MALLSVQNLEVTFRTDDGIVRAVNGLSFSVDAGKTLGIVGESGSGKSVSSLAIMKLIAMPPGRIESGVIDFKGQDLLKFSEPQMRAIRGNKISMIFQDPMTSLNPVLTVGDQIAETIMVHQKKSNREQWHMLICSSSCAPRGPPRQRLRINSPAACASACVAMALS